MTITEVLAGRVSATRHVDDVVDLRADEEAGYRGSGRYAVAIYDGRIVGIRPVSTAMEGSVDPERIDEAIGALRASHPDASLWLASVSCYQLMRWALYDQRR